jgi:hypothetical protein
MAAVEKAKTGILDGKIEVPEIADPGKLADFLKSLDKGQ